MSLNKFTDTTQKNWMSIGCKSLSVDSVTVESEKIYSYNIAPGSVGLEVWKIIDNGSVPYARFSGSRNFEIDAGITNPKVTIATPPSFYDKWSLTDIGPKGVISATMSTFGSAGIFGISGIDHDGNNIALYFTSDVGANPRPSIVSFDILYPIVAK